MKQEKINITKEILMSYVDIKTKIKQLEKQEKTLKKSIIENIDHRGFTKHTEKSKVNTIEGFNILKTIIPASKKVDYEKFYAMYYNPSDHPVVPKKEVRSQVKYQIKEQEEV